MIDMKDVEVPCTGTVVVQDGNVYDVTERGAQFKPCYCLDGSHDPVFHESYDDHMMLTPRAETPHLVGVQTFEMTWEVKR